VDFDLGGVRDHHLKLLASGFDLARHLIFAARQENCVRNFAMHGLGFTVMAGGILAGDEQALFIG
jgi:hypothetical protein